MSSTEEPKTEPLPTAVAESPPPQDAAPTAPQEPSSPPPPPPASAPAPAPAASSVGVRIRPKTCDVRNCDSNSLRNPEILFVSVPGHSYPERRFVWLTLMQAARDKKRSYCCSRHFKVPDDFKDFQEFISAPPGYKRQLLVKKGVVPHLNMPPLNMSALPPLTNRWPMTLPAGVTEPERQKSTPEVRAGTYHPARVHGNQQMAPVPSSARVKYCKAVQTEKPGVGPRKVAPSLQYCRLCFKRQDLEPIFTGDQTLIEPDLIDKIFGCTEVMISVESDFPSSICTGCYNSVHEFVKFRKLVQQNDRSLRGVPLPPMTTTQTPTRTPSHGTPPTSVRTKTTETIPNRPALRVTPVRPVNSVAPAQRREDPLLEVQRVENVDRYQRRQQTIERNQPLRAQRMQDTLYPVPYRRPATETVSGPVAETATSDDPLASAQNEEKPATESADSSSTPEGVQLNDRVVPVTLIRVQPETMGSNEDVELQVPNTGQNSTNSENKAEDVTVKEEEEESVEEHRAPENPSPMNAIRAKPIHQLMASPEQRRQNPPSVLQAVKLLPSATAKALSSQKPSLKPISTLTRGITSGRFPYRIWKPAYDKVAPKQSMARMLPKSLVRAVRFPGTMTTLFSGVRKQYKPATPSGSPRPVESPRPIESPRPAESPKPVGSPRPVESPKPVASPRPVGSPKPVASLRPADSPKPVESSNPVESPKPIGGPKPAVGLKPVESPKPAASPKPVGGPKPAVGLKPIVSLKPVVSLKPIERFTLVESAKPAASPKPAAVSISNPDKRKPPAEKPQVLKETKLPAKSTAASPVPKPKTTTTPAVSQPKPKENSVLEKPKELTQNKPASSAAKPSAKSSAPSPASKPSPKPKPTETPPAATPPAPSTPIPPPSPRSARIRKVPLKFQDAAVFPMPKIITVKADPDSPKVESPKVPQDKPKEPTVRTTRRSNAAEEKPSESRPPVKPDRKQPEAKNDARNKQPKEDETPKREIAAVRMTRRSDTGSKPSETQEKTTKPLKRKSDTKPDPVAKKAPPPSKSPKVEPKRSSADSPKTKQLKQQRQKVEQLQKQLKLKQQQLLQAHQKQLQQLKQKQLQQKKQKQLQQQQKQKQTQEQRANGSRKSVPTAAAAATEVKPKKPKEPELEPVTPPVSSQDWKCPFCSNRVFDQKKGLVKHLRKRHGMDYALVRQRLAIYGGNWR